MLFDDFYQHYLGLKDKRQRNGFYNNFLSPPLQQQPSPPCQTLLFVQRKTIIKFKERKELPKHFVCFLPFLFSRRADGESQSHCLELLSGHRIPHWKWSAKLTVGAGLLQLMWSNLWSRSQELKMLGQLCQHMPSVHAGRVVLYPFFCVWVISILFCVGYRVGQK